MKTIDAILRGINRVCEALAAILLVAAFAIMIVQVFTRYLFNFSFPWTEELSRFLIIYCVFFITVVIYRQGSHPKVEIVYDLLPENARYLLNYVFYAIMSAFLIFLVINGYHLVATTTKPLTAATRIPKAVPFAAVMIGSALTLLQTIGLCRDNYRKHHHFETEGE